MDPIAALKFALTKEDEAIELYKNLLKEHSSLQELISFLINEEYKHKQLIGKKIVELTKL